MHRRFLLALTALTFACPSDDDDDTDGETSGASTTQSSTTDGDSTTQSSTTQSSTTQSSTTDAESSESGDPTGESGSESDTTDASGDTTAGNELCAPAGADDPCTSCAKAMCCDAYAACYGDPDCVCAVDCIIATGDYETCLGPMCNMPDPTPAMDIGICYGTTCANDCGFGG